jgi:DNA polymerase elongation subunit (family B)
MWLMDAYRKENRIVLWIKTNEEDIRLERYFTTDIYLDPKAEPFLSMPYKRIRKKTYLRTYKEVLAIKIPYLSSFETFIKDLEKATKHRIPFYNADIAPEQMFMYKKNLRPCSQIKIENEKLIPLENKHPIPLKEISLKIHGNPIRKIEVDNTIIKGKEEEVLKKFAVYFKNKDPDVILTEYAFSKLPYLEKRLKKYNIECPFHRWDAFPLKAKGGKSYWSYNRVRYQDYAVRLRGRFLIDTSTTIGSECEPDAIMELAQLSGNLFQQTASRSFGAVFQNALVREMVSRDFLVPFKQKPIEQPLSMLDMLKADRGGHYFDPKTGFHKNVAEIDFISMFPWLIYNHNISADCILAEEGPFAKIPNVPFKTSMKYKGLIPSALKPFIDRRMHYKKNPTRVNKKRAAGLKWVLVSCYGYLRFREFKLGIPSSHMAICSLARETLLKVIRLAEEKGFEVVHAIVDSIYIKKKNLTESSVREFCQEIEFLTGIPVSYEGIFNWIVFLPSVVDKHRPLPSTYYGVFNHGSVKVRGIELRQNSSPYIVKFFQSQAIDMIRDCRTKKEIIEKVPEICKSLRGILKNLGKLHKKYLIVNIRVSKTEYVHNVPQKYIVEKLKRKKILVLPGQHISFIYGRDRILLPEEYKGKPNKSQYRKLLIRSLFIILQPFGFSRENIVFYAQLEKQTTIKEFLYPVKHIYIPLSKQYLDNRGLSEKLVKRRLEKNNWLVFRSDMVNILRSNQEIYPNVRRKYTKLLQLLKKHHPGEVELLQYINAVHHGLPDFLCFRNGNFKFVECKLQYETLSDIQKKTIQKLLHLGFDVEINKMVDHRTKARKALINYQRHEKKILDQQLTIKCPR